MVATSTASLQHPAATVPTGPRKLVIPSLNWRKASPASGFTDRLQSLAASLRGIRPTEVERVVQPRVTLHERLDKFFD